MDRITQSLLADFSREHSLEALEESERFEHFASYITVRRQYSETFDTSEIVTGAGGDTGIDAVAILVNGSLITDIESFRELAEKTGHLDVMFVFVQADRGASFEAAKIGTFLFGVQDFFREKPQLKRNEMIREAVAIMEAVYAQSAKFKRGNPTCRLYYVTTGKWQEDPQLVARLQQAIADLMALNLFRDVEITPLGLDGIQKLYSQTKNAIAKDFQFADRIVLPELPGVTEAYVGYISAPEFVSIIADEDGEIIKSIFYDNVRDWQDYNEVNAEIRTTLESGDRSRFLLMNNGVTIIARTLQATGNRFHIEDFQIVNGCQTSHVLFDQREQIDETVSVPAVRPI